MKNHTQYKRIFSNIYISVASGLLAIKKLTLVLTLEPQLLEPQHTIAITHVLPYSPKVKWSSRNTLCSQISLLSMISAYFKKKHISSATIKVLP